MRSRLPQHVDMDELMQAGMIGLNEALTRFEERRGASFETFAARRIQGAMLDELRSLDSLTRDQRTRQREMRSAVHRLEQQLGRAPRACEVADALGWTLDAFHRCLVEAGQGGLRAGDAALDDTVDEACSPAGSIEDGDADDHGHHDDPLRLLQNRQRHAALIGAFETLDERERFIMEMLYEHDMRQQDVGATLGVSGSRVSQLHEEIVAKLRRQLRHW